jgi:hypothetical protein
MAASRRPIRMRMPAATDALLATLAARRPAGYCAIHADACPTMAGAAPAATCWIVPSR